MPRKSREDNKTITKTYHIIIRGINKQNIFWEDIDKQKFLKEMKNVKEMYKFKIYAFVLMDNHVHLTIFDNNNNISQIMHKLCTIYAIYFNKKYDRTGHVFQNRFKNICVDTETYLLDLVRYIHNNPQNAGISKYSAYKWSSYHDYVHNCNNGITDIDFVLELFDKERKNAITKFQEFSAKKVKIFDSDLEFENVMTDEIAAEIIKDKLDLEDISQLNNLNVKLRNEMIYKMSKIDKITLKQISRIIGMGERNIQRIVKNYQKSIEADKEYN